MDKKDFEVLKEDEEMNKKELNKSEEEENFVFPFTEDEDLEKCALEELKNLKKAVYKFKSYTKFILMLYFDYHDNWDYLILYLKKQFYGLKISYIVPMGRLGEVHYDDYFCKRLQFQANDRRDLFFFFQKFNYINFFDSLFDYRRISLFDFKNRSRAYSIDLLGFCFFYSKTEDGKEKREDVSFTSRNIYSSSDEDDDSTKSSSSDEDSTKSSFSDEDDDKSFKSSSSDEDEFKKENESFQDDLWLKFAKQFFHVVETEKDLKKNEKETSSSDDEEDEKDDSHWEDEGYEYFFDDESNTSSKTDEESKEFEIKQEDEKLNICYNLFNTLQPKIKHFDQ